MTANHAATYRERLSVPVRWWVLGLFGVLVVLVAVAAAAGPAVWVPVTCALAALVVAGLTTYGNVRLRVDDQGLRAGPGRLPMWAIGEVEPLDDARTSALLHVEADPRAYLVQRSYVPRAVRVMVTDPADPTPYWLVSSRHPEQLADAIARARSTAG